MSAYVPGRRTPRLRRNSDVDHIVVERICAGDWPSTLTSGEMQEAVRRLTEVGMSGAQIARRLGVSDKTAFRYRARARAAA